MSVESEMRMLVEVLAAEEYSHLELWILSEEGRELIEEKHGILKELKTIKDMVKVPVDAITDDMIEQARGYPVENLFELVRGKVQCFKHQDRHPSMYHGSRTNKMVCPVCNETWDAIAVLMERDGYLFRDAVKSLCGR